MKTLESVKLRPRDIANQILDQLIGQWAFSRKITGMQALIGQAVFTPAKGVLNYHEAVSVPAKDGNVSAYQNYTFGLYEEGIEIRFVNGPDAGNLFMRLQLEEASSGYIATATHHCVDDVYAGRYYFQDPDSFLIEYVVRGPKKDYIICTRYRSRIRCFPGGRSE